MGILIHKYSIVSFFFGVLVGVGNIAAMLFLFKRIFVNKGRMVGLMLLLGKFVGLIAIIYCAIVFLRFNPLLFLAGLSIPLIAVVLYSMVWSKKGGDCARV